MEKKRYYQLGGELLEIKGVFSTYDLSDTEMEVFAEYLQHSMNTPLLEFLKYLLGNDYLRFIDIMAGCNFKIPSSKTLERNLEAIKVFLYVKKNGFTEDSIREASKIYKKSLLTTRKYIYKVAKTLGTEDELEGDDLINYILHIKTPEEKEKEK